jgi:L-asparagine transporter-like permease
VQKHHLHAGRRSVLVQRRRQRRATVVASLILLVLGWVYLLTTSVQNTFSYVLDNTGILYATSYCVTALAAVVYYRRRVMSNWRDMLTIGILPIAAVAFLAYIAVKSILSAPAAQNYSLLGFVVVGFDPHLRRPVRLEVGVLQDQAGKLEPRAGLAR